MSRINFTWVLIIAGPVLPALAFGGSTDLRPRFEAGQRIDYVSRSVVEHDVRVEALDLHEQVRVDTESGTTLSVIAVDSNGTAELEWRLRYLIISSNGQIPGIEGMLDYDSRKPTASKAPWAPVFDRLIDHPVTIRVDPSGAVSVVRGLDMDASGIIGALARSFFSQQGFEQLPMFVTLKAPSPAKVRSKWTRRLNLPMPLGVGELVMDQTFQFTRRSRRFNTARIEMKGAIRKAAAKKPAALGLAPLNLSTALTVEQGASSGWFVWDFVAGQLVSGETQLALKTSLDTSLGRMQLSQKMTTSITRDKELAPSTRDD